tara:strand:+ start:132 stop:755 length:624 start_codon:yes stop_codon:yes gene_type:complete
MSNYGGELAPVDEGVDTPDEFRVGMQVRVFNWSLDRAIRAKGWSRREAAAACGVHWSTLAKWLAFKSYPQFAKALEVSIVLGVSDEIIFPAEIERLRITKQPEPVSFGREEALAFGMLTQEVDPERVAVQASLQESVQEAMQGLSERQQVVLRMRFGLDGEGSRTLSELAALFGATRERIRQIEAKALRMLRHPSRSDLLRDYSHDL